MSIAHALAAASDQASCYRSTAAGSIQKAIANGTFTGLGRRAAGYGGSFGTGPMSAGGMAAPTDAMGAGAWQTQMQFANSRAAEQYRHLKDWVSVAVRPIAARISGQSFNVASVSKAGSARAFTAAMQQKSFTLKQSLPDCFKKLGENLEPIVDHRLAQLLDRPNSYMYGAALLTTTVLSLEATGKGFWWMHPDPDTDPDDPNGELKIWYMPASWVSPIHQTRDGRKKLFAQWSVQSPGMSEPIKVPGDMMAYFYLPDPADPLGAMSPMQTQARAVTTDEQIQISQYSSMKNGPRPGMVLKAGRLPDGPGGATTNGLRPVLTAEQRTQLITAIQLAYQGVTRHGHPIIVDGLIDEAIPYTTSVLDMDYPAGSELTKSRIMQGFGTNPIIAGQIEGANRATAAVADDNFCMNVVNPLITLLSQVATISVAPKYAAEGERLVVWIDQARPRDEELRLKEWMLCKGDTSTNERRKHLLNLPPTDNPEDDTPDNKRFPPVPKGGLLGAPAGGAGGGSKGSSKSRGKKPKAKAKPLDKTSASKPAGSGGKDRAKKRKPAA